MRYLPAIAIAMMMALTMIVATTNGTADEMFEPTRADGTNKVTIWDSTIAYVNTAAMDGVAVGDADPASPGNEVVTVGRDEGAHLTRYDNATKQFTTTKIYDTGGQPLSPAIGDLKGDPTNEIVVVGVSSGSEDLDPGNGTAVVLTKTGTTWTPEVAFEDAKLVHGVDIGDLDPTIPGNEMVVTTFNYTANLVWWDEEEGKWNSSQIFTDSHNVRKVVIADLLPERPGNEMVAVSKSGNVTLAYGNHTNWTVMRIHKSTPLARIAVGDIDGDGQVELYACGDKITVEGTPYAEVYGLKRSGENWVKEIIYTEQDSFRGVWVGDVDPNIEGPELYTYGYTGNLTRVNGFFGTGWDAKVIFRDVARGHEIRIGDVMPDVPGQEIAIVGYAKTLYLVHPSVWEARIAFKGTQAMDGVAIGDADPTSPGQEVVAVSRDMKTYLISYDESTGAFSSTNIWNTGGQPLTPVIGDLKGDAANEILVVGVSSGTEDLNPGDGTATVLTRTGSTWVPETAYREEKLIHGADIGDLDPTIPGNEAILTTFSYNITMIWWDEEEGEWNSSFIFKDSHNVRKVVIADILPERPGNEMVAVSKSGNVTLAYGDHTNWTVRQIHKSTPLARVAVGDIDGDGQVEIYACGDKITVEGTPYAEVYGLKRNGDEWEKEIIYTERDSFRGVWVGDVDPNIDGPELYTYGYTGNLTQNIGFFGSWSSKVIFRDVARGHEIRIGDVIPDQPGPEIAIVGYSATAYLLGLREAGIDQGITITGDDLISVDSGATQSIDLDVRGDGRMTVSATSPAGLDVEVIPGTLMYSGKTRVQVTAGPTNQDLTLTVTVTVSGMTATENYNLTVAVAGDKVAPAVSGATSGGTALAEGASLPGDANVILTFSKPVTMASFNAARTAGKVAVMRDTTPITADYTLSENGMTLTIGIADTVGGAATIVVSGLMDAAGNEMANYTLGISLVVGEPTEDITLGPVTFDGEPVNGANVVVTYGSGTRTGTTGTDGKVTFNVPESWIGQTVNIKVTMTGYDELTTTGTVGADLTVTPAAELVLVETEGVEPEDDDDWIIYLIVIIVVVVLLVIIIAVIAMGRKKEPEEEAPAEE